mgnify:CR=1 FL=1
MSNTAKNILAKVGGTPLVEISGKLNKGGAKVLAKVEFFNGNSLNIDIDEITEYATQYGTKNEDVREVTVWYPTVYCSNNVDIYDTPGLNDNDEMTAATLNVMDKMDVAIFTLSADSNFSQSESDFIGQKLRTSNIGRVIFVVTRMGGKMQTE